MIEYVFINNSKILYKMLMINNEECSFKDKSCQLRTGCCASLPSLSHLAFQVKEERVIQVFNRSAVIAEILKYIPFYERLLMRTVSKSWDRSFHFKSCWNCIDCRFIDLFECNFYFSNICRFVRNINRLELRIDQIPAFIRLLYDSLFFNIHNVESNFDNFHMDDYISQSHTNIDKYPKEYILIKLVTFLQNMNFLYISAGCVYNKILFTRVSPIILDYIESKFIGSMNGLEVLIFEQPVHGSTLLNLSPYMKNIKHLIITRIVDASDDEFPICSIVSELLENIPQNQLVSLQIGKTLTSSTIKYPKIVLSNQLRSRRCRRIELAKKTFGYFNPTDEGDELISLMIKNHSESIENIIVCLSNIFIITHQMDDIDISYEAYKGMVSFRKLKYSRVTSWSHLHNFSPKTLPLNKFTF